MRRRDLIRVLELQMGRWGLDARHPSGSLLQRFGFERFRSGDHVGSSRYRMRWRDRAIELHSSCAGIYGGGRPGFVFVRPTRAVYAYLDEVVPVPGRVADDVCGIGTRPEHRLAFETASREFLDWIGQYEAWASMLRTVPPRKAAARPPSGASETLNIESPRCWEPTTQRTIPDCRSDPD